jgi:predicted nucleic acid-binding protein
MTPFVLDCSVTMAWIFPDEATRETDALRESLTGKMAIVPSLWPLEVGNILCVASRRGRIDREDWIRIQKDLGELPIEIDGETHRRVWGAILPIAAHHSISVYDASYLELAIRLNLPLATLDKDLRKAGRKADIALC